MYAIAGAATLRGGESGVIGLILRDICEPFYAEMTAGLSEALEAHDKLLFLTQSGRDGRGLQRAFDALLAQGVDGIVLAGGIRAAAGLKEKAAEQGVPLVCVARSSGLDGVDVVRPDNMQAAKLATEFLIKRGHSQIAYLGGQSDSLTRAERLGGFCATGAVRPAVSQRMDRRVRLPAARGGGSGGTTAAPLPEHYRHRLPQGVGGARRLFWLSAAAAASVRTG